MTRLLTCGYETGDAAESGNTVQSGNTVVTVVSSNPTPRAGVYCMKVSNTATDNAVLGYKVFAMPAPATETWLRFAFFSHIMPIAAKPRLVEWMDSLGNGQVYLEYAEDDGLLRLFRTSSTVLLGVSGTSFAQEQWHVIELRVQMLSASTGTAEVWLDGNRIINFSGDVCSTTTVNHHTLRLGCSSGVSVTAAGPYIAFDDIAVNDTAGSTNNARIGDGRVVLLKPNGAGSSTQLARGGVDTGANYSQVNELPPSMAQYVSSATVGQRDLYALENMGVAVTAINVVEAVSLTQNSDPGVGSIAHTLKSGPTIVEGTAIGLSTTPGYVRTAWETDPNGGAAWTVAAVDALELGATIR